MNCFLVVNINIYYYISLRSKPIQRILNTMSQISDITTSPRECEYNDNKTYNNISLFIAHVFPNYTPADVAAVFERLRIGHVRAVDFVPKRDRDGKKYFAAYIHFQSWYDNIAARNFQARVLNPSHEARIVYDDPWHWIVLPYTRIRRTLQVSAKKQQKNVNGNGYDNEDWEIDSLGRKARELDIISVDDEMEEAIDLAEEAVKENDKYLVMIDSRYVQALEQENQAWRQWVQSCYAKA